MHSTPRPAVDLGLEPILKVRDLSVLFPRGSHSLFSGSAPKPLRAVDGVSFSLAKGEVLGLVGESGCGKSTLARAIMQLIPPNSGSVVLEGEEITSLSAERMRGVRLKLQMVFQDPYASLNPRMTVADALSEPLRVHRLCPVGAISRRVTELMEIVGLAPRFMRKYPHEFSGGQRQRIVIARALAMNPRVLIADEPVSALDVSIQAQILNLLSSLVRRLHLSLIFISHDLSVVKHVSDRVAVMYLGRIMEMGPAVDVIEDPRHPYTQALVSAIPAPFSEMAVERRPVPLEGEAPSLFQPPSGCPFHPRCPKADEACRATIPPAVSVARTHEAACLKVQRSADQPRKCS
ncbi:MAG: oligopeptide/dipeptide ABC transporter ATP-binding protein [Opitutaceae bacterium]